MRERIEKRSGCPRRSRSHYLLRALRAEFRCRRLKIKVSQLEKHIEEIKKPTTEDWSELDQSAMNNLTEPQQREFFKYKEQLRQDGHKWIDDAEVILRGFIWDQLED